MPSALVGAVVGTFKVGDGTTVGTITFREVKPRMTLKGGAFSLLVVQNLKQVVVGKGKMKLAAQPVALSVSSTPTLGKAKMTLRGQNIRLVTPTKAVVGRGQMLLRGKAYTLGRSQTLVVGRGRMKLKGGAITKVGRAGMVPSAPVTILLTPHGTPDTGTITPSPAQAGLLTPTRESTV